MVVTFWLPTSTASSMHEQTGFASSHTVHAEQAPRSQPIFVPVKPSGPRRASANVMRGSTVSLCTSPLTCRSITTSPGPTDCGTSRSLGAAANEGVALIMVAPAVVRAEPSKNERRDSFLDMAHRMVSPGWKTRVIYVKWCARKKSAPAATCTAGRLAPIVMLRLVHRIRSEAPRTPTGSLPRSCGATKQSGATAIRPS